MVEVEETLGGLVTILFEQGQNHGRHDNFHPCLVEPTAFGLGSVVDYLAVNKLFGVVQVNGVHTDKTE